MNFILDNLLAAGKVKPMIVAMDNGTVPNGPAAAGAAPGGRSGPPMFNFQGFEDVILHVVFESPGTAHEWQTWRRSLHDFAPRLFQ
jgi:enterochelin esterase-like enzyme